MSENVGLGEAAKRQVGVGSNQLPDMSSFYSLNSVAGYQVFPSGIIIQWGSLASLTSGNQMEIPYPISFPKGVFQAVACHDNYGHFARPTIYNLTTSLSNEKLFCSAVMLSANTVNGTVTRGADGLATYGRWIAIGH